MNFCLGVGVWYTVLARENIGLECDIPCLIFFIFLECDIYCLQCELLFWSATDCVCQVS